MFATRSSRGSGTGLRLRVGRIFAISLACCPALVVATLVSTLVSSTAANSARAESPQIHLDGMTFVASRGDANELVLHAARASFKTDQNRVFLEQVRASVDPGGELGSFEIECERGELDIESNDFEATGNVRGRTAGGRRFAAPWVRYDHAAGLLFTNAPVLISEDAITYRGGGFRYYVRERRFRLLGGASVVQQP